MVSCVAAGKSSLVIDPIQTSSSGLIILFNKHTNPIHKGGVLMTLKG